jgi:hypothetical protein
MRPEFTWTHATAAADTAATMQQRTVWRFLRRLPTVYSGYAVSRNRVSAGKLSAGYLRQLSVRAGPITDTDTNTLAVQQRALWWLLYDIPAVYARSEYRLPGLCSPGSVSKRSFRRMSVCAGPVAHTDANTLAVQQRSLRWVLHICVSAVSVPAG